MLSFQYLFFNQSYFFLSRLLVIPFIFPTTVLSAYLGGIIITTCIWSGCILILFISHSGSCSITFGKSFIKYPFTAGFRMRCRYFGIHTI